MIKLLEFLWSGCFHNWETIKEQGRFETYNISYPDGGKHLYKEQYTQYDLEVIFSMIFKDDFTLIDHLGLTQNISVWNDKSDI